MSEEANGNSALKSFRLVVFQAVAEHLSFTHAAEVLHLSQPAVTSHIKSLEDDLGIRLFDRSTAKVTVTSSGEILYRYTQELHRLSQQVLREIGQLNGEERGTLVIGASTTIAQYVLPQLLVTFLRLHPRVQVSVSSANTREIVADVFERRAMLGLIEGPPGTSELKTEDFLEDEIVVIVPAGHPWVGWTEPPTARDLAAEALVLREPGSGTRRVVEDALRRAGLSLRDLRVVMEFDSTEAIKSAVEAALGVGFVSKCALRKDHQGTSRVIQIEGLRIGRQFQFIYPHGPEPKGVAGAFLGLARQLRGLSETAAIT
jgi:DNA-binding transcriptional LysR family regulator